MAEERSDFPGKWRHDLEGVPSHARRHARMNRLDLPSQELRAGSHFLGREFGRRGRSRLPVIAILSRNRLNATTRCPLPIRSERRSRETLATSTDRDAQHGTLQARRTRQGQDQ